MKEDEAVLCVIDLYPDPSKGKVVDILFDTYAEPVKFSKLLIEERINQLFKFYNYSPFSTPFTVRKITGEKLTEQDIAFGGTVCFTSNEFKKLRLVNTEE